jgi:VTC domain
MTQPSATPSSRFEHKYLVPERLLGRLRRAVEPFVVPDIHTVLERGNGYDYDVHSVYFDTTRFDSYFEKEDGLEVRAKLRVRGYAPRTRGAPLFLEIKRRAGAVGSKDRVPVLAADLHELLAHGDVARLVDERADFPHARRDAGRFLFRLHRDALRPVVLVTYQREAYVGALEPSLRVTFDKGVRGTAFPELAGLFDAGSRPSFPSHFVLEVKHDAAFGFPVWLRPFIAEHGLVREALSKFWTCLTDARVVQPHTSAGARARAEWLAGGRARGAGARQERFRVA